MKYKLLILFITILSCSSVYSQNDKYFFGIDAISTTKGAFVFPMIGFNLGKIKLHSGILIGTDYVNNKRVLGLQADILFFPNKQNSDFNFFFINNINYFKSKVILSTSEVVTNTIQLTVGYGFDYKISKNLLFKSNFGLGGLIEMRKFSFETFSPSNKWGFAGLISFGVKYNL